jgi:hypothetical protein
VKNHKVRDGLSCSGSVGLLVGRVGLVGRARVCITFALFRSFVLHLSQLYLRAILPLYDGCLHDISAQYSGIPDPLLRTAVWTYEID